MGIYPKVTDIFNFIPNQNPIKRNVPRKGIQFWQQKINEKIQLNADSSRNIIEKVRNIQNLVNDTEKKDKSPYTRGMEQHAQNMRVKVENDKHTLDELMRKSNRSIISISSIFPWNFFPNTIDVEESRVTFIFRQLFASQSHSVDIKDISNVSIESGIFFSTLQVVSRTYTKNDIKIEYLRKKEALQTRKIIEGLRTLAFNEINTSNYEIEDLINKLQELNISKVKN